MIIVIFLLIVSIITISVYYFEINQQQEKEIDIIDIEQINFTNSSGQYYLCILFKNNKETNISCIYAYTIRESKSGDIIAVGDGELEFQSYDEQSIESHPTIMEPRLWEIYIEYKGSPVVNISIKDNNGIIIGSSRQQVRMDG